MKTPKRSTTKGPCDLEVRLADRGLLELAQKVCLDNNVLLREVANDKTQAVVAARHLLIRALHERRPHFKAKHLAKLVGVSEWTVRHALGRLHREPKALTKCRAAEAALAEQVSA